MFDIKEELKKLPERPGVYIMHQGDSVLYVGKAVNLKNRVRQYFQSGADGRILIQHMVEKVDWFEYIVTDTEMEAFILENNLIKEHKPPYNILLKDDKRYPYIKVTTQEAYPRILKTRTVLRDKNRYFGPYTAVSQLNETLELMSTLWPLRDCDRVLPRDIGKERPCLNYHIGKCSGPCTGCITPEAYGEYIKEALLLLEGRDEIVTARLRQEMKTASDALDFETAARLRDRLTGIAALSQTQKLEDADLDDERDVLALARSEGEGPSLVQAFFVRGGKLIGREHFLLETAPDESDEALMSAFLRQFYGGTALIPREIDVQVLPDELGLLQEFLRSRRDGAVDIVCPKRGKKAQLMRLTAQNAALTLTQFGQRMASEERRTLGAMQELGRLLGLPDGSLHRAEAYDISNTFGYYSVGSMVVFEDGKPKQSDYRKFRIKSVIGANDFRSLGEVLTRRFEHGLAERAEAGPAAPAESSFTRFPDLILMDGGAGQAAVAEEVMAGLGLSVPIAGMVKDDRHRTRALLYQGQELPLDSSSDVFHLITRIQDEAHRFAITYHRALRREAELSSLLEEIPGIGPAKRKSLTQTFGSVNQIKEKTEEELAAAPGISAANAHQIYRFFHEEK